MKGTVIFAAVLMVFASAVLQVWGQDEPIPSPEPGAPVLSSAELEQLLQPIALYPDPLIAQILPAATLPSQIALAANYLSQGGDTNQIEQQPWDSSVKAVAYYPDVLNMLNGNLPWTAQLGQAFVDQPDDVMNSIQSLRAQAQDLGNLESSPEQDVVSDGGIIEIVPTNPDIIYVPIYEPGFVFFQRPYGRHFISYGRGYHTGNWLNHDFDWHGHNVIVWDHDHPRPANWWREKPSQRSAQVISRAPVWRPPQQVRSGISPVRGEDRGYARPVTARPVTPESRGPQPRPEQPRGKVEVNQIPARPTVQQRAPAAVQRPSSVPSQRSSSGAFSGPQSAGEMRAASSRGQQSRQTVSRPAPAPAPRPSAPSGGGGEGGGGSHGKH